MFDLISKIAESGNTLVLVDLIKCGNMICERLPEAEFVSGEMKTTDRKDAYDDINTGTNQVVVATYGVAAVGINIHVFLIWSIIERTLVPLYRV